MKKIFLYVLFLICLSTAYSQKVDVITPPHWWVGMQYNTVDILLKGKNISRHTPTISSKQKIPVEVFRFENKNYLLLRADFSQCSNPETFTITLNSSIQIPYELKERINHRGIQGIDASDVIYLITPDRFANGDESNDSFPDMNQTMVARDSIIERHGGDLQGVISHLDYIQDLGMTATWLNPIEENNQSFQSYHGYGFTSHYQVDKRFGGNSAYAEYVQKSHDKNLKVVKDVVYNHIGDYHFLWKDKIDSDWFHPYVQNNYRATTLVDPYASEYDKNLQQNGWFAEVMPDLNQHNPFVQKYLIQYSLWWIEEYGIDAYRVDTHAYPDQDFMWNLMGHIYDEYPTFTIFGEVWDSTEYLQSWFASDKKHNHAFDIGITDFEMQYAFMDMAHENFGWNSGLMKIYYTLMGDYLYPHPEKNVIFLDNHDIDRYLGSIGDNLNDFKLATALLFTTRGIPQWYYGSEILMKKTGHHGTIREDFPGGWKKDKTNKFNVDGRTDTENEFIQYFTNITHFRKKSNALQKGTLKQFIPFDNIYVYFRYIDTEKVMVIINKNKEDKEVGLDRFEEIIPTSILGKEICSGKDINVQNSITIPAQTAYIISITQ